MSNKNTQHSKGAIRAAEIIYDGETDIYRNDADYAEIVKLAKIIDEETKAAEMLAFIEKIAAWDFEGRHDTIRIDNIISDMASVISDAQQAAFALIKKVRG